MNNNQKFLAEITRLNLDQIEQQVVDEQLMYKVQDLCGQLQIVNTSVAMRNVDSGHKEKLAIDAINVGSKNITVKAWFVTETGIYQMILHNKTDVTKRIRNRIATDLLPRVEMNE